MEDFPKESSMKLGMVGLGKMGANIIRRLLKEGHQIIAYDLKEEAIAQVE
jgi:6-phosphogluconate dehydrogenase